MKPQPRAPEGRVLVALMQESGRARLRVEDTGVGIAVEHMPHLFERFYRGDPSTERVDGGAALGLAIGQWIAEAHGGLITVESELGRGSMFIIDLPPAQLDLRPAHAPPAR